MRRWVGGGVAVRGPHLAKGKKASSVGTALRRAAPPSRPRRRREVQGRGGGLRARSIEPAGSLEEASVGERSTPNAK